MKIKELHIDNFGKLQNFNLPLEDGLTALIHENGWGKSTLAAFIRVMFYGFEGENNRKNIIEKERRRYKPWQGGVYGGQIVFETAGKTYRLCRTFDDKSANDTFELYELFANGSYISSNAFDETIGEKLFGINAESFRKTVFISQNDIETGATGEITGKLSGGIVQADVATYGLADERLKNKLNGISSKRATGELSRLKGEITTLESEVRGIPSCEGAISANSARMGEEQKKLAQAQANLIALNTELVEASKAAELRQKQQHYYEITENFSERQNKKVAAERVFESCSAGVPDEAAVRNAINDERIMREKVGQRSRFVFSEDEQREFDRLSKTYAQYGEATDTDEGVKAVAENAARLKKDYEAAVAKQNTLTYREANLVTLQTPTAAPKQTGSSLWLVLIIVGLVCVVGGVVAAIALSVAAGVCGALVGAALGIAGILMKSKARPVQTETPQNPTIIALQREIDEDKAYIAQVTAEAEDFLKHFPGSVGVYAPVDQLAQIKGECERYAVLTKRAHEAQESPLNAEITALNSTLTTFLASYEPLFIGDATCIDHASKLQKLYILRANYQRAADEFARAKYAKDNFEANNPDFQEIVNFNGAANVRSVDAVNGDIANLSSAIDKLKDGIHQYENEINRLSDYLDGLNDSKEDLGEKQKRYAHLLRREKLIGQTRDLLACAKSNFVGKLSAPVARAFQKYADMMRSPYDGQISFDANLQLNIEEGGSSKDIKLYSAGMQDKINLCFRLGLIDAMFTQEKPVLVMDDPFTNLDGDRLADGKRLLDGIAEDYQVIYLTCHESRMVNTGNKTA